MRCRPENIAHPRPTAISSAGREKARAPSSCPPLWRRSPPSKDTSRTSVRMRAHYRYTHNPMALSKFKNFSSRMAPLKLDNIDTDQIIPARYLTATDKKGFGKRLFMDLRYEEDGTTPKPDFVLNQKKYKGAKILLAHENFGCGSSREHAPWALIGAGFTAVIAISFADIFKNNSAKNGLLLIELPRGVIDAMHADG